ncbi:MAG TPA: MFS transporter [Thermoplasmata archaeon]|nr:MFS transporter [Thermoplasmata archaeon]
MASAPTSSRWILFIVILGTLMASVDTTIVLLAFPTITGDLHADLTTVLWTILIYLLLVSILTTQAGRISDLFGHGRFYTIGFVVFTFGSALCGFAQTAESLVAFRAVQAVGGAFMVATGTAILADTFPAAVRGKAFGYTTMGWNVGATLGIVLGGVLTTFVGWRYIFFINVPIGVVAVVLAYRYLGVGKRTQARLDIVGMLLLAAVLSLIVYGATDFASYGASTWNLSLMAAGTVMVAPFLWWERRSTSPTIHLALFRSRLLSRSLAAAFLQSTGYLATVFLLIMYLQGIRGLTPLDASLLLVPGYVLSSGLAPTAGHWADRFGAARLATIGIAFMLVGVLLYAQIGLSTPLLAVALISLVTGIGGALFWPSNNKAVMHDAPPEYYGSVSGLLRTLGNSGTIASYTLVITVASLAVSRPVAFRVFVGGGGVIGSVSTQFLAAIHAAFYVMAVVLVAAAVLSASRISRTKTPPSGRPSPSPASPGSGTGVAGPIADRH